MVCASLLLLACAAPDVPRLDRGIATGSSDRFDSPRETALVESTPDIGRLVLTGRVSGRDPEVVFAPADGFVSEVAYGAGDIVDRDAVVLRFSPEPTTAEHLEREIALLQLELAAERGESTALAEARTALDQIDERLAAEGRDLAAPASGVIQGTRTGVGYSVSEGDQLFSVVDAQDLLVAVAASEEILVGVTTGAPVLVTMASGGPSISARVDARAPTESGVELQIDLGDSEVASVDVGDLATVEVSFEDALSNQRLVWVPDVALHRESGRTFLLVEQEGGALRRIDTSIVRRTETHAQVQTASSGLLLAGSRLVLP